MAEAENAAPPPTTEERIAALEGHVQRLAEIAANLLNEREMAMRNMAGTTRCLNVLDERLSGVEKVVRKARRSGLILPDGQPAAIGHG